MNRAAEVVLNAHATLGEGPSWDGARQRLLWVDILERQVGLFNPQSGENRALHVTSIIGSVVPTAVGGLMAALQEGFARIDPASGAILEVCRPPEHDASRLRFNDGKCDPFGRFWAGTMALDGTPAVAALYCLDTSMCVRKVLGGVSNSNGIAWSRDGHSMYYIDTPLRTVQVFDFDGASAEISNGRIAFKVPATLGFPDGMTIDAEGKLWVALWDGGALARFDPQTGELLDAIELPVSRVTACAFGGIDLKTLYITSARVGLTPAQLAREPLAGAIFAVRTAVPGFPASEFGG